MLISPDEHRIATLQVVLAGLADRSVSWVRFDSIEQARTHLAETGCDLILLDTQAGGDTTGDGFTALFRSHGYIPIILLSELGDEALALKTLRSWLGEHVSGEVPDHGVTLFHDFGDPADAKAASDRARFERLGKLMGGVAHEINTPLTYLKTNGVLLDHVLKALRETMTTSAPRGHEPEIFAALDRALEVNAQCRSGADRIERIIKGLYRVSFTSHNEATVFDLREAVEETLPILGHLTRDNEVSVRFNSPSTPVMVRGDTTGIAQVVLNLVKNAIEASPQRGTVDVGLSVHDGKAECTVDDQGPGVPENLRANLFEPYVSTKSKGMGVGLALSSDTAMRHGGSLRVSDRPGGGTRFSLMLPIAVVEEESMVMAGDDRSDIRSDASASSASTGATDKDPRPHPGSDTHGG